MKFNKKRIIKFLLFAIVLTPLLLIASLFSAKVQKYLLENQLHPWIDTLQVEYIHITPFAIKVNQLHLKYQDIDVHIGDVDSEFSPFELFSQRLKVDKLIINNTRINNLSETAPPAGKETGRFLFPGLFPYLDTGYIYDIGKLDIDLEYNSPVTGPVRLRASAENINETHSQPLNILVNAPQLKDIPDIQAVNLDAAIFLNQHLVKPIDRQHSRLNIQLHPQEGLPQNIALTLAMEQLPKPEIWDSFPFDKRGNHYLTEILHPEKIQLELRHTEAETLLSQLRFNGIYDGNEGVISGNIRLTTENGFLALFKSLELPEIKSKLSADFVYNTRTQDGFIDLNDQFKIRHYLANNHSLPDELDIENQLSMKLDGDFMQLDAFLLNILSQGQEYIKVITHKPLLVNLKNIQALLDQQQSDLLSITINQLPLDWFNDFIPGHRIKNGILDTDINLSVAQRSLLLKTRRPFSISNLTLVQEHTAQAEPVAVPGPDLKPASKPAENEPPEHEAGLALTLLANQFMDTDFNVSISDRNLSASLERLDLFQLKQTKTGAEGTGKPGTVQQKQLSTSLQFELDAPVSSDLLNSPLSLSGKGRVNIDELIKIPLFVQILNDLFEQPLSESLPKQLNLDYQLSVKGKQQLWTLKTLNITLNARKHPEILSLKNLQDIKLQQNNKQVQLLSRDKLLSLKIKQFDFSWLKPVIAQYASPYQVSGYLSRLDTTLASPEKDSFDLDIHQLSFTALKLSDDKQLLFDKLKLKFNSKINYAADKISIHYPVLAIEQKHKNLLTNKGSIILSQLDKAEPHVYLKGDLNAHINHLMQLKLLNQFTHKAIRQPSVLNGKYQLTIVNKQLNLSNLLVSVFHPVSKGRLEIKTHSPLKISLQDGKQNFSQNGHLTLNMTDFDITPYEVLFPQLPVTFDRASTRISLTQKNRKQTLTFEQPLTLHNVHYKNTKTALLNPFDLVLNARATQSGKNTRANIQQFSIQFIGQNNKALELSADISLNSARAVPVKNLNASLNVLLTQWLSQPGIMPKNTLNKGTLKGEISLTNGKQLSHKWQVNDLTDRNGQQLIKSINIDGSGEIRKADDLILNFPLVMQSLSGTTELTINNHIQILNNKPAMDLTLDGKEIFLNDLLKLLAAINPESEISRLEQEKTSTEQEKTSQASSATTHSNTLDNTPAQAPFWPTGLDIAAKLDINRLYYSDYMSYHNIRGKLSMNDEQLNADNFEILFHDSPMKMDADFKFIPGRKQPYDINLKTSLSHFYVGGFLKELNPNHVPRAEGVFDVDILFYGPLSNLTQIRNELMFNIDISGLDGVYHLIPADNVMARSGGHAMAIAGEVVSVLPTSGFGLGIINRVVRFAKDINYDLIRLSMSRQSDLNTHIDIFEILSPELHLIADGQISFKPNTGLMDQDLNMEAHLNLSGEGAAIFYGLGLLNDEQDEYGFWKGPTIKFWGSISDQQDNFDEIINKAKEGTLAGGITNPFSGLVGNFKYRWTGTEPDYSKLLKQYQKKIQEPSAKKKPD